MIAVFCGILKLFNSRNLVFNKVCMQLASYFVGLIKSPSPEDNSVHEIYARG